MQISSPGASLPQPTDVSALAVGSAGSQFFLAPAGIAGLICLAWIRGQGFTGPTASGCVPSLNLRKGWL